MFIINELKTYYNTPFPKECRTKPLDIEFYFGQDAKDIRDKKKPITPSRQILYGHNNQKKNYTKAQQFDGQNCVKVGKTQSNESGLCIRENVSNQNSAVDHADFIAVLPEVVTDKICKKIERHARNLMRDLDGFQKIPDATVIDASGNEWTAWDNNFTDDKTNREFERIFKEVIKQAYEKVVGVKPSFTFNRPSWADAKTSLQKDLSDEIARGLRYVITKLSLLISLPTGTGKEPLTLEALLVLRKKLGKEILNVLWNCPSPLNDILSEVMKWNEFYCCFSVYTRCGNKMVCVHKAASKELIRLVIVSLPSLKAPDRSVATDPDLDDADYDAEFSEEEANNTINALKDFMKEHGPIDVIVQDESHDAYDTCRTDEVYCRLKKEGIVVDNVINIRKSATDYNGFMRAKRSGGVVVHRSIAELTPQMVNDGRWPKIPLVVIHKLMSKNLLKKGWSEEEVKAQMASKNPRDWNPLHCEALLEALIYQVPAKAVANLPQRMQDTLIRKLYSRNQGTFLIRVSQVVDGNALLSSVTTTKEVCGDGFVHVGKVQGQPVAFVKVYGSDRSCNTEHDLNNIVSRQLAKERHVFILTCGAFCQGSNIPELDAVVLVGHLKSMKRITQFRGRLNRSRKIQDDTKFFVVLDDEAGTSIQLDIAAEEHEHKLYSGKPTDPKSIANTVEDILPMYDFCDSGWKAHEHGALSDEWSELLKQTIEKKWDNDKTEWHDTLESNTAIGTAALSKNKPQNITLPGIGSGEESDIPEHHEPRPAMVPKDLAKQVKKDKKTRLARANDLATPIFKCALYATRCNDSEVKRKDQLIDLFKLTWEEYSCWFEAESWFKKNETNAEEVLAVIDEIDECWLGFKLSKIAAPVEYDKELKNSLHNHVSR